MNRREFLMTSLRAVIASAALASMLEKSWCLEQKRVLVLGGTVFLGPALVEALVADGHAVTLFNRGVTNPDLFPHVEKLHGFRSVDSTDQDFTSLANRHFDAIVDVWPQEPEMVASAARFLKDRTHHYLYTSSIGAYEHREFAKPGTIITETTPLQPWDLPGRAYNRNKAESERRLHDIIGDHLTIVRPTGIKGHRDDTPDLLTWLLRMRSGGEHIAPGNGREPFQMVDVKDVARFIALAIAKSVYGTFNLTGKLMTFREYLEACRSATGSDAVLTWIPKQFLHEHNLESDAELHTFAGNFPSWLPEPDHQGFYRISSEKAFKAGWRIRPFDETAFDCLKDYQLDRFIKPSDVLSPAKEKEVLDAWKRRTA
jgi:2'-hydroxyisoflavone reductase